MPIRLAIFATHPIQYQAVLFRQLAKRNEIELCIFFGGIPSSEQQGEGFGFAFRWDLPLLDGYEWCSLAHREREISLYRFFGLSGSGFIPALKQFQPHVALVLGWNSLYLLQALIACKAFGIPVMVRGDSNDLGQRAQYKRRLQRLLFRAYDAFLYVGQANRSLYERAGVAAYRLFFAPHFVDNHRFARQAAALVPKRGLLRQKFSIPSDSFCFLFVGKFEPKKRLLDLLAAIKRLQDRGSCNIHLLVIGTGEQEDDARCYVEQRRLPVSFGGFLNQSEIAQAYVAAECLVLPSDAGETWGLVVNEAMACGRPAIVSSLSGCGEDLVMEKQTGLRFLCGDIDALADAMTWIAADPARTAMMGREAAVRVADRYSVHAATEGVLGAVQATTH